MINYGKCPECDKTLEKLMAELMQQVKKEDEFISPLTDGYLNRMCASHYWNWCWNNDSTITITDGANNNMFQGHPNKILNTIIY